jgi:hypothetical protein
VPRSLLTLPLRISLRTARVALATTRDAADAGLGVLELIGEVLQHGAADMPPPAPREPTRYADQPVPSASNGHGPPPSVSEPEPVTADPGPLPIPPAHVDTEAEIVEELAEPGAENGAGAQIRVATPFDGYDALRAADVVARVRGADAAQLGAIELYEQTHRKRRTVLQAVTREQRRPR